MNKREVVTTTHILEFEPFELPPLVTQEHPFLRMDVASITFQSRKEQGGFNARMGTMLVSGRGINMKGEHLSVNRQMHYYNSRDLLFVPERLAKVMREAWPEWFGPRA